jgi:ParB family chromosome partitioning protein
MASVKTESIGRKDLFLIDPSKIFEKSGWNVRDDSPELQAHIEELSISIAEIGVQQPLTVYMENDVIYLSDGHCRLQAVNKAISKGAEIKSVPCRVEERYSNEADRVLAMIVRNSGKSLTPLEKSKVVKQLLNFGWKREEIATKCGMSNSYIGQLLEMQAMPEDLKLMVTSGSVSASTAVNEFRSSGDEAVDKISKAVKKGGKATKKKLDINPERKAIKTVSVNAEKYSPDIADKILDLCDVLESLMIDENLNREEENV